MNRILSKKFFSRVYSSCFLNRIEVQSKYNVYFIILISAFEFHCIHSHSYAQDLLYRSVLVSISIIHSDKNRFLTSRVFNVIATFKVFFKSSRRRKSRARDYPFTRESFPDKYFLRETDTKKSRLSCKIFPFRISSYRRKFRLIKWGTKKKKSRNCDKQEVFLMTRLFVWTFPIKYLVYREKRNIILDFSFEVNVSILLVVNFRNAR